MTCIHPPPRGACMIAFPTLLPHTLSQMETMGSFEKQFENLDLQTAVMDDVMGKQVRCYPPG